MERQTERTRRFAGLGTAALLGLALLAVSFARIVGDATSSALGGSVLSTVLDAPLWSSTLGRNLALFALALLALHVGFALACWLLAALSGYAFPTAKASRLQWVALWCIGGSIWVFTANAALFPHSSLGEPYADIAQADLLGLSLYLLLTILFIGALAIVTAFAGIRAARSSPVRAKAALVALGAVAGAAALANVGHGAAAASSDKPHVVIIGLDSLRYDVTGVDGGTAIAPNVGQFLAGSARFSDAITPLARTFPSWVSILTGRHPHTTGAVINLLPRDVIHTGDTLGDLFRKAGYRSVYGIDEARFSNVDASYGFDQAITPPIGATEFLVGFFGDTPLSNLVVNSRLGSLLFPFMYANRGVATTYDPDEFVRRLERNVRFDKPTFLAVHLTLVHWPYSWRDSPGAGDRFGEGSGHYPVAVKRVDRQFQSLLSWLERSGVLENAIVVVLSDHGEALGPTDNFLLEHEEGSEVARSQSYGHGTSVFSPHQFQTLLAMRGFGRARARLPAARVIDAPVSLEDLAPTLTELFGLDARQPFDGRSLVPVLRGQAEALESIRDRVRFTETEFTPPGLALGTISTSGIAAAAAYYTVNPATDRIEFRRDFIPQVLKTRQFAAFGRGQMLAAVPAAIHGQFDLMAAPLDGSPARHLSAPPDPRTDSELARLQAALEKRFAIDVARRTDANR